MDPRILKNPTDRVVEITFDNKVTIFNPGEVRPIDGAVANHALKEVHSGLVDVTDELNKVASVAPPVVSSVISPDSPSAREYTSMKIGSMLKLAKSRGIPIKFGMKKLDLIKALIDNDSQVGKTEVQ